MMSLGPNDSPFVNSVLVKSIGDKSRLDLNRVNNKLGKDSGGPKEELKSEHLRPKPNLNFSISNILSKENNLMHSLRDNFLSGKQCDQTDWLTVNGLLCAASQLHSRPNFPLDPLTLHSTLLSAHFLSNQQLPRKPTPWYPWSLSASSGLLTNSHFDSAFNAHANLFASKEGKRLFWLI